MATPAQIEANRQNAQKSTGPKTCEGKFIASQNAATHGLTADRLIIDNEDRDEFNALYARMMTDLAPVGPLEQMLAERIIAQAWRIRRSECMESGLLNVLGKNGDVVDRIERTHSPLSEREFDELAGTLRGALQSGGTVKFQNVVEKLEKLLYPSNDGQPKTVLGCIAIEDFRDSKILERLLRYQGEIERSLYKAVNELQRIQAIRKRNQNENQEHTNPSVAIPPAV